jgi:hypothetical protein
MMQESHLLPHKDFFEKNEVEFSFLRFWNREIIRSEVKEIRPVGKFSEDVPPPLPLHFRHLKLMDATGTQSRGRGGEKSSPLGRDLTGGLDPASFLFVNRHPPLSFR